MDQIWQGGSCHRFIVCEDVSPPPGAWSQSLKDQNVAEDHKILPCFFNLLLYLVRNIHWDTFAHFLVLAKFFKYRHIEENVTIYKNQTWHET